MPDPQDMIKKWLSDRIEERGHRSTRELADRLSVSTDAIRRMRNRDGSKESRRIEAHHIPVMAEYFSEWPPGYEANYNMSSEEKPEPKPKAISIDSGGGNVTVVDKSINVNGDHATVNSANESAADLLGKINAAIGDIYRDLNMTISLEDIGHIALQYHTEILTACESEEEYPHAIEIMKLRLKRRLAKT